MNSKVYKHDTMHSETLHQMAIYQTDSE